MVIDACALAADLSILPAGDMTEIGEKVKLCFIIKYKLLKYEHISSS